MDAAPCNDEVTLHPDLPALEALASGVAAHARAENFPVALRVLPARPRMLLQLVYNYARFVDDVGDRGPGDRLSMLELVELDVRAATSGTARISVVRALAPYLADGELLIDPLLALIAANRQDQTVTSYATFADLLGYCRLSAAPVGELVLHIAGAATPDNLAASEQVCAGLQVLEHCQDVGEDARCGRVYLPADDLGVAGVSAADLTANTTSPALRAVVRQQVGRAEQLLRAGDGLVARLHGWARVAVAGYVAGGLATADALRGADFDVLGAQVAPRRGRTVRRAAPLLAARRADPDAAELAAAYRYCERITWQQARNFAWGIRLLPGPKRRALAAVYAFARRIDDIGDGGLPAEQKVQRLEAMREALRDLGARRDDPVLLALENAAQRLPVPLGAFDELIDGCEMDVTGRSYTTIDELVEYCRCVAGSIGRLSLGVFHPALLATASAEAAGLADALGIALQLTNILRDVREDAQHGRVYLPAADLARFGCTIRLDADGRLDAQGGALPELVRFEAARARDWYDRGLRLLPLLDRRSAACCAAMAGIYRELLDRIASDPEAIRAGRVRLSGRDKARIAVAALTGAGRG